MEISSWLKQNRVLDNKTAALDFSQMRKGDSSVLALMLHLQSHLPAGEKVIAHHFPQQLKVLLELYDLEKTFELR